MDFAGEGSRGDARVQNETVTITGSGDVTFRIAAPGGDAEALQRRLWAPPGIRVEVDTDATGFAVTPGKGYIDVTYRDASRFVLSFSKPQLKASKQVC